ncbi:unnamed protein product [Closterium sp. NIES-54]
MSCNVNLHPTAAATASSLLPFLFHAPFFILLSTHSGLLTATGPGGAHTRGTGAAGAGGVGGVGVGDPGAGDPGAGGAGAGDSRAGGTSAGGTGAGKARAGDSGAGGTSAGGAGAGGVGAGDSGAQGARAGGTGAGGAGAGDPGDGGATAGGAGASGPGAGGTVQQRPFFVPPSSSFVPPPDSVLRQPDSPLPAPSLYTEQTYSLTERREPMSRPALPACVVCTGRHVPCPHPPPVPGTHIMALRPSSIPLRVPMPSPPASSLADGPDPESDLVRAASPTVTRLLATVIIDPSFESAAVSALVAELVEFAAACRLDYAASLVAESESECPPSVEGECALGTDVLEYTQEDFDCLAVVVPHLMAMLLGPEGDTDAPDIPTPRSYAKAITGPYSSQWQTPMDTEMASWKSTHTYIKAVPPSGANIVDGFSERQGVDFFHTFSPTPKMTTTNRVLLHVAALYLGLQITRDRAQRIITLTQSHMVHQVLQRFDFWYSSPQSTPLPTGHSLSAPPSDESVEPSGLYPELVGCLIAVSGSNPGVCTCRPLPLCSALGLPVWGGVSRSALWMPD